MVENYQVHGSGSPGEAALLAANKLTKDEVAAALKLYAEKEQEIIGTILGVSLDGVVYTPTENWHQAMKGAFADIGIVPWIYIQELLGRAPDGTTGLFMNRRGIKD